MGNVHSVNGRSNSYAAEVKEPSEAMKEAAEASKKAAEKAAEAAKQAAEKAAEAAKKTDSIEISEKAEKLSESEKTETTSVSQNNNDDKVEGANKQATATEKATTNQPQNMREVVKEKKAEIKQVKRDLREIGVEKKEIKQIERNAKKESYASIKDDLKQLSKDYKSRVIDKKELKNAIYGIAAKQLDGVLSGMKDAYNQKMAFVNNNDGSTQSPRESIFTKKAAAQTTSTHAEKPGLVEEAATKNKEKNEEAKAVAKKEDKTAMEAEPAINAEPKITEKATPPGLAAKEEVPPGLAAKEEVPPGQAVQAEKSEAAAGNTVSRLEKALKEVLKAIANTEELPPGLEKKEELPGNSQNATDKIADMFNDIGKMVAELDEEGEGADEKSGLGEFVSSLKNMFSDVDSSQGNDFLKNLHKVADEHGADAANKVGKATIQAETLSGLLKGGQASSNSGINRVGDSGEGSGNFTATNFMADMSSKGVSDGLDSYREAKEAREDRAVNEANEAGKEKQANAEAQLSVVA